MEQENQILNENNNNNNNNGQTKQKVKGPLQSKPLMSEDKVKESAKNSRLRKKLYIELLERKVNSLSDNIDETLKDID